MVVNVDVDIWNLVRCFHLLTKLV